jgi:uncharacterized protein
VGNRFSYPDLGLGLGLRANHYFDILSPNRESLNDDVQWFEILSENYMQTQGRPLYFLDQICARYPVALHGVSMSIGSTDPLDIDYLVELKALQTRTGAKWVSDHLCFTGAQGRNTHDLLPMPYTEESLVHVVSRIKQVQSVLGARIALENPSTYLTFTSSTMPEWEFLRRMADDADCALLLDVNNIYVSCTNNDINCGDYMAGIPWERVVQLHVSGHTNHGTHIIDSHIGPVIDPVWTLLGEAHARSQASVLLEWDAEIPSFDATWAEAKRARNFLAKALA